MGRGEDAGVQLVDDHLSQRYSFPSMIIPGERSMTYELGSAMHSMRLREGGGVGTGRLPVQPEEIPCAGGGDEGARIGYEGARIGGLCRRQFDLPISPFVFIHRINVGVGGRSTCINRSGAGAGTSSTQDK